MWVTKQLMVHSDFHSIFSYYQNQWGPATVWLPTFFKILFCVQHKKEIITGVGERVSE